MSAEPLNDPPDEDPHSGGMSYTEIARALGLSRNAVFRIENRALRKLREILTAKGLRLEDFIDCAPPPTPNPAPLPPFPGQPSAQQPDESDP